jgi:RNA polymerase sigma-70 factor, ECF subfamily
MEALTAVLHDDATLSMPPYDLWLQGHEDIVGWMLGVGSVCRGSQLVPTAANGMPAFAHYHAAEDGDGHTPWALMIMEIRDGRIAGINSFLDTARWFPLFDLSPRLRHGDPADT